MMVKSVRLAWALCLAAPMAARAAVGDCPGGCAERDQLKAMAAGDPAAYGALYDNGRTPLEVPPAADDEARLKRVAALTASTPAPPRPGADVPPPETKKSGGFLGGVGRFIDHHKWDIAGALAGGLLTFFLGGGLFGILAGIALSFAVAYAGPKVFGKHKKDE